MQRDLAHCGTALALLAFAGVAAAQSAGEWGIHDEKRPLPPVVDPGTGIPAEPPGKPPADAVVLFDGKDLSQWRSQKGGGAAPWLVENGTMQVVPGSGGIETTGQFGACQLHVEWMEPTTVTGESQDRGNSGVYLMGLYEVQVLESHEGRAQELTGPTAWKARPPYKAHAARLPISLQDHNHPVRYRNIWIRELTER